MKKYPIWLRTLIFTIAISFGSLMPMGDDGEETDKYLLIAAQLITSLVKAQAPAGSFELRQHIKNLDFLDAAIAILSLGINLNTERLETETLKREISETYERKINDALLKAARCDSQELVAMLQNLAGQDSIDVAFFESISSRPQIVRTLLSRASQERVGLGLRKAVDSNSVKTVEIILNRADLDQNYIDLAYSDAVTSNYRKIVKILRPKTRPKLVYILDMEEQFTDCLIS